MRMMRWVAAVLLAETLAAQAENTGTDPAHKYAWGENVGWANAAPTNVGQTVTVHFDGDTGWLSGHVWGENIGWIVMGSAEGGPYANTTSNNWGVNLAANGDLSGYAWSENIGWINFGHALCDAAVDPSTGVFAGHAWGENIGWLKFKGTSPDYGVRSMAFYTQPQGTPNWWLANYGIGDENETGIKGIPAWQDYVADMDPTNPDSYLYITAISNRPATTVYFPSSARRYYTLQRRDSLLAGDWTNVTAQVGIQGADGLDSLQDTTSATQQFYRVTVKVLP